MHTLLVNTGGRGDAPPFPVIDEFWIGGAGRASRPHRTGRRAGGGLFFRFILLLALVGLAKSPAHAAEEPRPNVLVVHSYHVGMAWADDVTRGLHEQLAREAELVFTHLDIKRFPDPRREQALVAEIAAKVAISRPAVVVAIDDFAYDFLVRHRATLIPDLPLVFGGVNFWSGDRPEQVSGVVEPNNLTDTVQLALTLHPQTRRLVVVNDRTETGRANRAALEPVLAKLTGQSVLFLGHGSFAETEAALAKLDPRHDVVLLLSWNIDATNATRSYETAIARARAFSPAPLYGVWDFYFGQGLVGGYLLDGATHGGEVAHIVSAVLHGKDIDTIPITTHGRTDLRLDERELKRFGISPEVIPPGAEIRYREANPLAQHARLITTVAVVLILQGITIVWLVLARASRKRAEASLRTSEADLRLTLESINDAVISTDASAQITRMNPVAEQLTGWQHGEAHGRAWNEVVRLVELDTGSPAADPTKTVLSTGKTENPSPVRLIHRNGSKRTISYSMAPIRDNRDGFGGTVTAFHDITAQIRLEEQLRQAQKMESLGLLAGGVAHDFNNVLQAIYGNLQLIREPAATTEENNACLDEIGRAAARAADLTRQLLAFGRRQKLAPTTIDLAVQTESLLKMVRRLIGIDIKVSFAAEAGCFWVKADGGQIDQVILNLCLNARDAMPQGGRLSLELDHISFSAQDSSASSWIQPGNYVLLTVADTGSGMDKQTLDRIFEPFFTTKPTGHGTGLGLSVVQGIVQQHEGLINAYSEPGVGTTFRVYLPAWDTPGPATPALAPETRTVSPRTTPTTVLLAEDDLATRNTACKILRRHGCKVLAVADGEEACAIAAAHEGRIDVAVLDVVMPRLGGPETARRLMSSRPGMPIILCSGHPGAIPGQTSFTDEWLWLTKPYAASELLRHIDALMDQGSSPPV